MSNSNIYIDKYKTEFNNSIDFLKSELSGLRTGRAQATLVQNVQVLAYGVMTPLMQLSNISVPDAQTISIEPWDKNLIKDLEKALTQSNLGFSVVNTGDRLMAKIPAMTEENRKGIIKIMKEKVEDVRIRIRKTRDKVKEEIIESEKNKEISEDDKFKYLTDLDEFTSELNKKIEVMSEEKETEIMKV